MTHTYVKYEKTPLWDILKNALYDLVENQDIEIMTGEEYIIGYLCDKIVKSNFQIPNDSNEDS